MKRFIGTAISLWITSFGMISAAAGQPVELTEAPRPPLITVSGDAEVKVVPDHVVLTLGVESFAQKLADAKHENDQHMAAVLAAVKAKGVAEKDVQTDYINVETNWDSNSSWSRYVKGYTVRKTAVVNVRKLADFEPILSAVLENGANTVQGIEFRTSELRKHRDEARAMAIKAAREKAQAMAAALDMSIGTPFAVTENQSWWGSGYGGWWGARYNMMAQNASAAAVGAGAAPSDAETAFAPGEISVRATVQVSFKLTNTAQRQ